MRRVRDGRRTDDGQVTLLIVGFAIVLVLMIAVVTDASAAYLRRQGLDSLADGAALAAGDGVQGREVYTGGLGRHARIDPLLARRYAAAYLRESGARRHYPGLSFHLSATATRVDVTVAAPMRLPITAPGLGGKAHISSHAASYVVVSR